MTEDSNKSRSSGAARVMIFVILAIVLLFLLEGALSVFLYQKEGTEELASIELIKTLKNIFFRRDFPVNDEPHFLTRPDSSKIVNHAIAMEAMQSNRFVQESWIEFRNMDFNGRYMHMSGLNRRSEPEAFFNPASKDTLDIYFFGGSTMFGFNVLDNETIPSQFVQLYREKYPKGKSIRVFNYGIPTYYSYQELILFTDLIFKRHHPGIAVFLDGINDFWFATAAYYRQSYFSYVFRQAFNKGLKTNGDFQLVDTADNMFRDPLKISPGKYNETLVTNYFENMDNIRRMSDVAGTQVFFFTQPSPFYHYGNQQKDPVCFKDTNTRFNYIYPLVKQKGAGSKNYFFLGDMLQNEGGYPFIDGLHYSPAFIRKVAARILDATHAGE